MVFECEILFINEDEHMTFDSEIYRIVANDEDEAELLAFMRAEDHPSWTHEDIHECVVTKL